MGTKIKGVTVAFEREVSEEYAEKIIDAIKMISNVHDVQPIETTSDDYFSKSQLSHEFKMKLYNFINEELK